MTLRRKQMVGTKYDADLDAEVDRNQDDLVDELITPHVRLPERHGGKYKIVSSYPAYEHDAQPVQARGRVVWNKAFLFQSHGPSYLDPIPDSDTVPHA